MNSEDRLTSLTKTCNELQIVENYKHGEFRENIAALIALPGYMMTGGLAAAFSKFTGSSDQVQFLSELSKIKKIKDPIERIKQVYLLAGASQGRYDYSLNGVQTDISSLFVKGTPGVVIDQAKKTGVGGVCRHFAILLYWSLLQVARKEGSSEPALTEGDFSPSLVFNKITFRSGSTGGHVWVRINLPRKDQKGKMEFSHFDLDTTWYPKDFAILYPRNSSLTESQMQQALQDCKKSVTCLMKNNLKMSDKEKSQPVSQSTGTP